MDITDKNNKNKIIKEGDGKDRILGEGKESGPAGGISAPKSGVRVIEDVRIDVPGDASAGARFLFEQHNKAATEKAEEEARVFASTENLLATLAPPHEARSRANVARRGSLRRTSSHTGSEGRSRSPVRFRRGSEPTTLVPEAECGREKLSGAPVRSAGRLGTSPSRSSGSSIAPPRSSGESAMEECEAACLALGELVADVRERDPVPTGSRLGRPPGTGEYVGLAKAKKRAAEEVKALGDAEAAKKVADLIPEPVFPTESVPLRKRDELRGVSAEKTGDLMAHLKRALDSVTMVREKSRNIQGPLVAALRVGTTNIRVVTEELFRRVNATGDLKFLSEENVRLRGELEATRGETEALRLRVSALEAIVAPPSSSAQGEKGPSTPRASTAEVHPAARTRRILSSSSEGETDHRRFPTSSPGKKKGAAENSPRKKKRRVGRKLDSDSEGRTAALTKGQDINRLVADAVANQLRTFREEMCQILNWHADTDVRGWDVVVPLSQRGPRLRTGTATEGGGPATAVVSATATKVEVGTQRKAIAPPAGPSKGAPTTARERQADEPPEVPAGGVIAGRGEGGKKKKKKKKKRKSAEAQAASSSARLPDHSLPPRTPAGRPHPPTGEEWSKVLGRREKEVQRREGRKAVQQPPPSRRGPGPPTQTGQAPPTKGRSAQRVQINNRAPPVKGARPSRPPRAAAITVTATVEGEKEALAQAMAKVRREINLGDFDIAELRPKRAMTGALILEVPGPEGASKADRLSARMAKVLEGDGVKVSRPSKRTELRIHGLEDSISGEEVRYFLSLAAGCSGDEIKVGAIRSSPLGLGSAWAQGPMAAFNKIAAVGKVRMGWVAARVELLATRPLQCYRCLEKGHTRQRCTSKIDRSDKCYRCGLAGHLATKCSARPKCPLCADLGRPAEHRLGAASCAPVNRRRRPAANTRQATDLPPSTSMEVEQRGSVRQAPTSPQKPEETKRRKCDPTTRASEDAVACEEIPVPPAVAVSTAEEAVSPAPMEGVGGVGESGEATVQEAT